METVEQLTANFKADGYANPQLHAECKHRADVVFDVQIKNKRRFISPVLHNIEQHIASDAKKIKSFYKKGGQVHYLQPKRSRKVYVQVAIPASSQAGIRPHHKLTPEQAFAFDVVKMMS